CCLLLPVTSPPIRVEGAAKTTKPGFATRRLARSDYDFSATVRRLGVLDPRSRGRTRRRPRDIIRAGNRGAEPRGACRLGHGQYFRATTRAGRGRAEERLEAGRQQRDGTCIRGRRGYQQRTPACGGAAAGNWCRALLARLGQTSLSHTALADARRGH